VANIAPLDWLPQLLSSSGGSGICTTVVLQSLAQARTRWGADQADAIWDASTVRIVFGGLGGAEDLTRISRLAGEVDEEVRSHTRGSTGSSWSSSPQRRPALPIDYLRTLPEGKAVVLHRRTPPVEAVFDGWWKLPVAEQVRASLKTWETDAAVAP
jgi:type IV secretion system protein VirD4